MTLSDDEIQEESPYKTWLDIVKTGIEANLQTHLTIRL